MTIALPAGKMALRPTSVITDSLGVTRAIFRDGLLGGSGEAFAQRFDMAADVLCSGGGFFGKASAVGAFSMTLRTDNGSNYPNLTAFIAVVGGLVIPDPDPISYQFGTTTPLTLAAGTYWLLLVSNNIGPSHNTFAQMFSTNASPSSALRGSSFSAMSAYTSVAPQTGTFGALDMFLIVPQVFARGARAIVIG